MKFTGEKVYALYNENCRGWFNGAGYEDFVHEARFFDTPEEAVARRRKSGEPLQQRQAAPDDKVIEVVFFAITEIAEIKIKSSSPRRSRRKMIKTIAQLESVCGSGGATVRFTDGTTSLVENFGARALLETAAFEGLADVHGMTIEYQEDEWGVMASFAVVEEG